MLMPSMTLSIDIVPQRGLELVYESNDYFHDLIKILHVLLT